jgi:hypothetical protein
MTAGSTFLVGGLCPVTGGNPTKMTEGGFARACAAALAASREAEGKGILELRCRRCLVCRGKLLPDELTIIALPVTGGEEQMGSKYEGTCACCGRERKQLQKQYGEGVCPSCAVMRTLVKNMPEVVVEQLQKLAEFPVATPVDGVGENSLLARLRDVLQAGDGDIVRAAELAMDRQVSAARALAEMVDVRKALKAGDDEEILVVAKRRMELLAKVDRMAAEAGAERDRLADEVRQLRRRLQAATAQPAPAVLEARECSCSGGRDEVLFDLLIEALGDQVINLDAARIKALREVRHG